MHVFAKYQYFYTHIGPGARKGKSDGEVMTDFASFIGFKIRNSYVRHTDGVQEAPGPS